MRNRKLEKWMIRNAQWFLVMIAIWNWHVQQSLQFAMDVINPVSTDVKQQIVPIQEQPENVHNQFGMNTIGSGEQSIVAIKDEPMKVNNQFGMDVVGGVSSVNSISRQPGTINNQFGMDTVEKRPSTDCPLNVEYGITSWIPTGSLCVRIIDSESQNLKGAVKKCSILSTPSCPAQLLEVDDFPAVVTAIPALSITSTAYRMNGIKSDGTWKNFVTSSAITFPGSPYSQSTSAPFSPSSNSLGTKLAKIRGEYSKFAQLKYICTSCQIESTPTTTPEPTTTSETPDSVWDESCPLNTAISNGWVSADTGGGGGICIKDIHDQRDYNGAASYCEAFSTDLCDSVLMPISEVEALLDADPSWLTNNVMHRVDSFSNKNGIWKDSSFKVVTFPGPPISLSTSEPYNPNPVKSVGLKSGQLKGTLGKNDAKNFLCSSCYVPPTPTTTTSTTTTSTTTTPTTTTPTTTTPTTTTPTTTTPTTTTPTTTTPTTTTPTTTTPTTTTPTTTTPTTTTPTTTTPTTTTPTTTTPTTTTPTTTPSTTTPTTTTPEPYNPFCQLGGDWTAAVGNTFCFRVFDVESRMTSYRHSYKRCQKKAVVDCTSKLLDVDNLNKVWETYNDMPLALTTPTNVYRVDGKHRDNADGGWIDFDLNLITLPDSSWLDMTGQPWGAVTETFDHSLTVDLVGKRLNGNATKVEKLWYICQSCKFAS